MVPSLMKHGENVLSWLLWRCFQIQTNQESLCFALFLLLPLLFICVKTMQDSFSWRHEKLCGILWTAMARRKTVIFTHPTQYRRVWLRGLGDWLNSSPYSWIFNSTLCQWIPGLAPFYFLPRHHVWHKSYHIWVLHFRDRRGAASFHHRFRAATTILLREQKPSLVWFSWRSRSCPVSEYEHSL